MANGTLTLTEARGAVERLKNANKRLRDTISESVEGTVETAAVIGGGALGGYVQSEYPDKEVMGVNINLAAGAVLTVTGIMGWAGAQSNMVGSVGEGMLAYEAGRRVAERDGASAGIGARLSSGQVTPEQILAAIQNMAARAQ